MVISTLDALLLFLVRHKAQSGYDVRRLFQTTPLGIFSDSPGAIYPALQRLERRGILASIAEPAGRRRRVFERTAAGEAALREWLSAPVAEADPVRRPEELDLRFVMIAETLGPAEAGRFLDRCAVVYAAELERLEAFHDGPGRDMDNASLLALGLGIRLLRTRLQWCVETAPNLEVEQ